MDDLCYFNFRKIIENPQDKKEIEQQSEHVANTSNTSIDADFSFDSFIEVNSNNIIQVYEEDEDTEQLSIRLDDLSITTMLTENSNMTESKVALNDDDFHQDLKKLDQKIQNVKQILFSMK